MVFSEIIGQNHIKSHLVTSLENGRIPHAQIFSGINGSGLLPLALAYANEILSKQYLKDSTEYQASQNKVNKLIHPNLHFVYPVNTGDSIKKNAISDHYAGEWREFVLENPYASLFDWMQYIGVEKKQGNISKYEAESISRKLSLKAYEGGYKVMIVWMAENMNMECANKILKLVEEPSDRTVLLLLTENEGQIITTIRSRCQALQIPPLAQNDIAQALTKRFDISENLAIQVAIRARGDYNRALQLKDETGEEKIFEKWFIIWVRSAFRAKGNKQAINHLLDWSDDIAKQGRETQKKFILYCSEVFRQAMLKNYKADSLIFFEANDVSFEIKKFAPFVHQNNIFEISASLEEALYHIERNGNAKIIFTDLSIQLTRLIHRSEAL